MTRPLALVALSLLSGCATITQGTHADVEIRTRPEKAQIWVDGVQAGTAPAKVSMEVNATHVVVIRAPGYEEQTIRTDRVVGGGYILIDILLGVVPLIVDAATGAYSHIQPIPMNVMLTPQSGINLDETAAKP